MKKIIYISLAILEITSFVNSAEGMQPHYKKTSSKTQSTTSRLAAVLSEGSSYRYSLKNDGRKNQEGTCWFNGTMQCLCSSTLLREQLNAIEDLWMKSEVEHNHESLLCYQLNQLFLLMEKKIESSREQQGYRAGSLKISEQRKNIIATILSYCDNYEEYLPTEPKGGESLALFDGTVNALHKELITLYLKTAYSLSPDQEKRMVDMFFTRSSQIPNFDLDNLSHLPLGQWDRLFPRLPFPPSPVRTDGVLSKIIEQHDDFCRKMYNIEVCLNLCSTCNKASNHLLLRSVMMQNLVPEDPGLPFWCNVHELYRKCPDCRQRSYDKTLAILKPNAFYQVTAGKALWDKQWNTFVENDPNFTRMSSATIYAVTAGGSHTMAAVRKNAETILLMDDDIAIECHPKSWKELSDSVKYYFARQRPYLQFKHLSGVVFNEPIPVPMSPGK